MSENIVSRRVLLNAGLWFVLFNAVLIALLSMKYVVQIPDLPDGFSKVYLTLFAISHSVVLALIPYVFVFLPVTILTRCKRKSMIAAAVSFTLYLLVLVIDSYIFSLYRFHINSYVIEQIAGPGAGQVFEISTAIYVLAVVLVAAIFAGELFLFKFACSLKERTSLRTLYICLGSVFAMFIFCQASHAVAAAKGDRSIVGLDKYFPLCKPCNMNSLLVSLGVEVNEFVVESNFTGKNYQYPKTELITEPTGKNVLFFVLDSWHFQTMDSIVSPNIYNFSKRCSKFNHHCSGSNGTRTGVFSMFFGLPGVYWNDFKENGVSPVMMDEFQKAGYDVKLFPSASLQNPPLDKNVFVKFADQCGSAPGEKAWQRDVNLTDNFVKFLRKRKQSGSKKPFFSFLFYDSLHSMIMPDGYKGKFSPAWEYAKYESLGKGVDPTEFFNLYKNMVYYLDGVFADVLKELESQGLLDNTIIVITGDHGQEFDDNKKNFWGHNGNYSDAQIRVPMLYFSKDRVPAEYDYWTAHYDIVPTIMEDVFKVKNEASDYSVGHTLFEDSKRDFLLVDSYIGYGMIDEHGNITNILYGGECEILDNKLNECYERSFDDTLYKKVKGQIEAFYASGTK